MIVVDKYEVIPARCANCNIRIKPLYQVGVSKLDSVSFDSVSLCLNCLGLLAGQAMDIYNRELDTILK